MRNYIILVKGKDDFGREAINDSQAKFDVIGYERPDVGKYILIVYPEKKTYLFYQVSKLTTCIEKDYPYCYSGIMDKKDLMTWLRTHDNITIQKIDNEIKTAVL